MTKIKSKQINDFTSAVRNQISASTGITITNGAISATLTGLSTTNLSEGTNLYYTQERVEDAVNTLLTAGAPHTGISYTYTDNGTGAGALTSTVSLAGFSIDALSDVAISSAANGQVLSYNGTSWVNSTASSAMSRVTTISTTSIAYVPPAVSANTIEVAYFLSPASMGNVTLTNITAAGNAGLKLTFKKLTASLVIISPAAGESIDGFTGGTDLINQYASLTLISNGTSWSII